MPLTDTFAKNIKHTGAPAGDKHTDGGGMYLMVKAGGKYWRMDETHAEKLKTLALGVYPEVSPAKARQRRDKALELLADGIDPAQQKKTSRPKPTRRQTHSRWWRGIGWRKRRLIVSPPRKTN